MNGSLKRLRPVRRDSFVMTFAIAVFLVGCDRSADHPQDVASDPSLLLPSEPNGAITPSDAMQSHLEPGPIVLIGRVDAGEFDPFEAGKASFMLSELPDAEHAGDDPDHADNCPFCKRKLEKAPKAVVKFLGDDGEVLAVDSRELLGISKGDTLVVRGTGRYAEAVNLVEITANAVFRR